MANVFTSYLSKNVGTAPISVASVPAATTTTIIGLTLSNVSSNPIIVDVYITRNSVDYYLLKGADITQGGAEVPIGGDQKVVLIAGDILKVKSSVSTSLDVILSVLNVT